MLLTIYLERGWQDELLLPSGGTHVVVAEVSHEEQVDNLREDDQVARVLAPKVGGVLVVQLMVGGQPEDEVHCAGHEHTKDEVTCTRRSDDTMLWVSRRTWARAYGE